MGLVKPEEKARTMSHSFNVGVNALGVGTALSKRVPDASGCRGATGGDAQSREESDSAHVTRDHLDRGQLFAERGIALLRPRQKEIEDCALKRIERPCPSHKR